MLGFLVGLPPCRPALLPPRRAARCRAAPILSVENAEYPRGSGQLPWKVRRPQVDGPVDDAVHGKRGGFGSISRSARPQINYQPQHGSDKAAASILESLDEEQRQAVTAPVGPVMVTAGPGSGKTRVLTHRVAYLIAVLGVDPSSILAVTFTNKAADEMRTRVDELVERATEEETWKVRVGTIHSICVAELRRYGGLIGLDPDFTIVDTNSAKKLIGQSIAKLKLRLTPSTTLGAISRFRNCEGPGCFDTVEKHDTFKRQLRELYKDYSLLKKQQNVIDFDDILEMFLELLKKSVDVRTTLQRRFPHILVDEFQDTNKVQYNIIRLLTTTEPHSLFVVGDYDQSIYAFRGAEIGNLSRLPMEYQTCQQRVLRNNYRSTAIIVGAAQNIISQQRGRPRKEMRSVGDAGEKMEFFGGRNEYDQARFIVNRIGSLVQKGSSAYSDIGVLYRTNQCARIIETTLAEKAIPFRIVGAIGFYGRAECQDIIAYLKLLRNPKDDVALVRAINTPKRGIGATSVRKLHEWAQENNLSIAEALTSAVTLHLPLPLGGKSGERVRDFYTLLDSLRKDAKSLPCSELVLSLIEKTDFYCHLKKQYEDNYDDRVENIRALVEAAGNFEADGRQAMETDDATSQLALFLEEITMVSSAGQEESPNAVICSTVHASKGLEYPVVFMFQMSDGMMPLVRKDIHPNGLSTEELDEERRLAYVGLTRAKSKVFATFKEGSMSRFLEHVPPNFITASGMRIASKTPSPDWRRKYSTAKFSGKMK